MRTSTELLFMTYKGTEKKMQSHRQRNNAMPTSNIWPASYSRDHCHTAKLESNWRVSTN
jgi:hypothetical protein